MKTRVASVVGIALVAAAAAYLLWPRPGVDVNLYCSVDTDQYMPIVQEFEKATGLKVGRTDETEASRSIGITKKLDEEKDHPVADVVWANEAMNTANLARRGLFAPFPEAIAKTFPAGTLDRSGTYVRFVGRGRILLVNTKLLPDEKDRPTRVEDLLDPRWGGEGRGVAMAYPVSGTTYTHAVALLVRDEARGREFLTKVSQREGKGLKLYRGNGAVALDVADATKGIAFGLTDTDDARAAIERGAPCVVVYPDQGAGESGTLLIPNTLALVKGAPHPKEAERLLAFLAQPSTEERLASSPIANIPVRPDVKAPAHVKRAPADFRAMDVDWDRLGQERDAWRPLLERLFGGGK
jgi:iron(III) transport system substrate-binding protein